MCIDLLVPRNYLSINILVTIELIVPEKDDDTFTLRFL